jgi:hypothetical protein
MLAPDPLARAIGSWNTTTFMSDEKRHMAPCCPLGLHERKSDMSVVWLRPVQCADNRHGTGAIGRAIAVLLPGLARSGAHLQPSALGQ